MARRIENIMSDLFKYSPQTYFNHKKEKRPILELLEKYFTKDDLEEFLEKKEVSKFETQITNKKNKIILDEINKKQQEIEELKQKLDI